MQFPDIPKLGITQRNWNQTKPKSSAATQTKKITMSQKVHHNKLWNTIGGRERESRVERRGLLKALRRRWFKSEGVKKPIFVGISWEGRESEKPIYDNSTFWVLYFCRVLSLLSLLWCSWLFFMLFFGPKWSNTTIFGNF